MIYNRILPKELATQKKDFIHMCEGLVTYSGNCMVEVIPCEDCVGHPNYNNGISCIYNGFSPGEVTFGPVPICLNFATQWLNLNGVSHDT